MTKLLDLPPRLMNRRMHYVEDDFANYTTAQLWTAVLTDSGTAAIGDAACGVITLSPSDGTEADNDEAYLPTTKELFKFDNDKPIIAEARIQFAEVATNAANVFFGMADAISANTLVDNGGGLKTSFSGMAIYKVDGSTVWKCVSSLGSTQTVSTSGITAGGSAYQTLRVEFTPITSTVGEVRFFVDGVQLRDANNFPIKHQITYTSATEMQMGCGVKNGTALQQPLLVDYMVGAQLR